MDINSVFFKQEIHYPTCVVDNFYEYPDAVREMALSLEFKDNDGRYPGKRTDDLSTINLEFCAYSTRKFVSLFYDMGDKIGWEINTAFQLIEPYSTDADSVLNKGWIHQDYTHLFAGIVFLNKNANFNSGTKFYNLKAGHSFNKIQSSKENFYKTCIPENNYAQEYNNHVNNFDETMVVNNVYNRLIAFDANTWHSSDTLYNNEPRLTQVFFVKRLTTDSIAPIPRIRKN